MSIPTHITWLAKQFEASGSRVRLVQTHVSCVLLTGTDVYKFKKPVQFDFIDLRTLEARQRICEEEVRLNSRLCAELYHGVIAIFRTAEGFRLSAGNANEGEGELVDYAVQMRQLTEEHLLEQRILRGDVTFAMIGAIAGRMARFHDEAETSDSITARGGYDAFIANWQENFRETADISLAEPKQMEIIKAFVREQQERLESLLRQREQQERIRDCHGDLRADAVWIDPADPQHLCIFDCLEFSDRYRLSDTGLDIAFLAMDLEAKGRRDLADLLISLYCQASGDSTLPIVLRLYACYRAFVRFKVRSLFASQPEVESSQRDAAVAEAQSLLRQAAGYAGAPDYPGIRLVCGLSGSGKSVLAGALAARLGSAVLSSDVIRKQLLGVRPTEPLSRKPEDASYSAETTQRVYGRMLEQARILLSQGFSVVLDGAYPRREQREAVLALAAELSLPLLVIECRAPDEVIRQRQELRAGQSWKASDANYDIYLQQKAAADPVDEIAAEQHLILDSTLPLEEQCAQILQRIPPA